MATEDADSDADTDEAAGEARGDEHDAGVVLRRDEHVVVGLDRDARARVGVGVRVEERDGDRAGDADRATAGGGDDGDELLLARCHDDDVARGLHARRAVDVGVRVQFEDPHAGTDADAGAAGDREGGDDAELEVAVAGGDAHRLVAVGAGVGAGRDDERAVDAGGCADERRGVHRRRR